jgi:predicted phage tail protein
MIAVQLHGRLADRFGTVPFTIAISSLAEAIRALSALVPGFRHELRQGAYKVVAEHPNGALQLGQEDLDLGLGRAEALHIMPVVEGAAIEGAGGGGTGKIILGVALIAGSIMLGPAGFGVVAAGSTVMGIGLGNVAMLGVGIALAGVTQAMAPSLETPGAPETERRQSFMFNGAFNNMEQGHPVPLVIGRMRTGSIVASAGVRSEWAGSSSGSGSAELHGHYGP